MTVGQQNCTDIGRNVVDRRKVERGTSTTEQSFAGGGTKDFDEEYPETRRGVPLDYWKVELSRMEIHFAPLLARGHGNGIGCMALL